MDRSCACGCSSDACALIDAGSNAGSWDCSRVWTTTDSAHSTAAEPSKLLARSFRAGETERRIASRCSSVVEYYGPVSTCLIWTVIMMP